uniref:TEP1-F n=2 Tax=Anopheles marajoara TaxID=58244 RepID=A0A2M4B9M7_9DIPT
MWSSRSLSFCLVLTLVGFTQSLLIIGPKSLRANREYTVVVSNFISKLPKAELLLRLEGHDDDGQTLLNMNRSIDVRSNTNKATTFKIPSIKRAGNFKITIEGVRGFVYNEEVDLEYISKSVSGLIQLSKPVYKPGDSVQFRVIVLDPDMKPPSVMKTVTVTVQDSFGNNIRKWSDAPLYNGVFEGQLDIAPSPLLGKYNVKVEANNEELVSKSFEVKEYVLSTFEVNVYPTVTPLEVHQALNLTIVANYYFGKPVIGKAKFQLYDEDDNLELSKEYDVNGMLQVHLPFTNNLILFGEQQDVRLNVTFTEQFTNRTVTKERYITVYKHKYQIKLEKESPAFRPGSRFKCALKVEHRDGTPAKGVTVEVATYGAGLSNQEQSYKTDDAGSIKLQLNPSASAETIQITATIDDQEFEETIIKVERNVEKFIEIDLKDRYVGLNHDMKLKITCSDQMTFFVYYIVSKGNIVDYGFARPAKAPRYLLTLKATEKMMPRAKVVVVTITNNIVVFDYVDIEFSDFQNKIDIRIDEATIKPGRQIEIKLNGHPKTYVALASYDESLHQHGNDHDILRENIWKVFEDFHAVPSNEHDKIHSMGLFAKTLNELTIDTANDKSARTGEAGGGGTGGSTLPLVQKLIEYRTNFRESWLWKNITVPRSGRDTMLEQVPDSITSWYLTGFSIDRVHGIGIIKKPIRYTTVQQFYIVDNLPYSIKRDEVIALQFTLFNTLGAEYIADVTMYSVRDELEFVGQPGAINHTKTVSVPPNIGFPISFLVKAKKLGEMIVRVKASIMLGLENDAIEKVIRVTPESLEIAEVKSQFFSFRDPSSQTYEMVLDINRLHDANSVKIDFSLTANILTDVVGNLQNLLAVPSGCGEQNMVNFVPNIVVLDYLTATGSQDTTTINKAKNYLQIGYSNQMKYRQTDGSYGVWQTSGGSVFLTAFVAKSMQTAAKYIFVDEYQVSRAYDWLSSKQQSNGRYNEVGSIAHQDMQGGLRNRNLALTSYAMIAFLENEKQATRHRTVVERGMKYIADNLEGMTDSYDLAIATYALWLNNHSRKSRALDKLIGLSTEAANGTQRYWPRHAHQIETTAYALLSFVEAGRHIDGTAILRWLVNQRYTTGAFPRTQDTFVGLKALTKLSQKINPSMNDYSMTLTYDSVRREYRFNSENKGKFAMNDIPEAARKLSVNIAGQGSGFIQLAYKYLLNLKNFEKSFKLAVTKSDTDSEAYLKLDVCASFIPKLADQRSNMALIEVNLPSGYITRADLIQQKPGINPIKKMEILYGATTAVLYYDNMGIENNCFSLTAYRLFKVALNRPAYVKVHDYYHPEYNAVTIYETVKQEVCDVCDPGDCPPSCSSV